MCCRLPILDTLAVQKSLEGAGRVRLSEVLARKHPGADREWGWQGIFPTAWHDTDRHTGARHRHPLHESAFQRAVQAALWKTGRAWPGTPRTVRMS